MKPLIFAVKAVFGMIVAAFVLLFLGLPGAGLVAYVALSLADLTGG